MREILKGHKLGQVKGTERKFNSNVQAEFPHKKERGHGNHSGFGAAFWKELECLVMIISRKKV